MITRKATVLTSLILLSGICIVVASDDGPLLSPRSSFRGRSFEKWNVLWTERNIEVNLATSTQIPETLDKVRMLPSVLAPGSYEYDITLPPGTSFVTCPFFIFGEHY